MNPDCSRLPEMLTEDKRLHRKHAGRWQTEAATWQGLSTNISGRQQQQKCPLEAHDQRRCMFVLMSMKDTHRRVYIQCISRVLNLFWVSWLWHVCGNWILQHCPHDSKMPFIWIMQKKNSTFKEKLDPHEKRSIRGKCTSARDRHWIRRSHRVQLLNVKRRLDWTAFSVAVVVGHVAFERALPVILP